MMLRRLHLSAHHLSGPSCNLHTVGRLHRWISSAKRANEINPELNVVYGDWDSPFVIIEKPEGVPVQALPPLDSVENRLLFHYNKKKVLFPHRLDKHTSGLLCVAFTADAASALSRSQEEKTWAKKYRVVVDVPPCSQPPPPPPPPPPPFVQFNPDYIPPPPYVEPRRFYFHEALDLKNPLIRGSLMTDEGEFLQSGQLRSFIGRRQRNVFGTESVSKAMRQYERLMFPCGCHLPHHGMCPSKRERGYFVHPFIPDTMLHHSLPFVPPERMAPLPGNKHRPNKSPSSSRPSPSRHSQQQQQPSSSSASSSGELLQAGKKAVTNFEFKGLSPQGKQAMYEVELETGRTHQIRVHFSEAGFPVTGDPYYNLPYIYQWCQDFSTQHAGNERALNRSLMADDADPEVLSERKQHTLGLQAHYLQLPDPLHHKANKLIEISLPVPQVWKDKGWQ